MTPQELKNSILQMAIQGKLVEQRPEEGTAEELYQQIQKEKAALVKQGKIKKEKPLPEIAEDEKPFDIPDSWMWVRLGNIATVITKGTTPRGGNVAYLDHGIGFLRAENVAGLDYLDKTDLKYIDNETHTGYLSRSILQTNDILITIAGTLGRTALVRECDLPLNANQAVSMVRLVNSKVIDLMYLIFALNAFSTQKALTAQKKVTAIPNLTLEIISMCMIPIPPLSEQKRIVTKIEEMLPLIDRYEEAWTKLEDFNKRFPGDLQKSLLQMAIQGKLVEQRPEEGTAEELYQQIQKEKAALIKQGKIKKEKPLPEIAEDEKPFDIPDSWRWVHLNEVAISGLGKTLNKATDSGDICQYLCSINVYWEGIKLDVVKEAPFTMEDKAKYLLKKGDLLICEGGDAGRCAIWNYDNKMYYQNALHRVRFWGDISVIYFKYIFELYKGIGIIKKHCKGETIQHLVQTELYSIPFPLPPLAEQKRIVAKLEELLPLCDKLKKN